MNLDKTRVYKMFHSNYRLEFEGNGTRTPELLIKGNIGEVSGHVNANSLLEMARVFTKMAKKLEEHNETS